MRFYCNKKYGKLLFIALQFVGTSKYGNERKEKQKHEQKAKNNKRANCLIAENKDSRSYLWVVISKHNKKTIYT